MEMNKPLLIFVMGVCFLIGVLIASGIYIDRMDAANNQINNFITQCNYYLGEGQWKVEKGTDAKWTCIAINNSISNNTIFADLNLSQFKVK